MSIRLEGLTKLYDRIPAVSDLTLEVAAGELLVLLGPSGSGKSTVLRMIAGLAPVDSGRVLLGGEDVTELPAQKREIGLVFQHYALFRHLTVAENVEFALAVRGIGRAERRRRREELLELVGLGGLGARLPRQLSGGQQQRVALARALAHQPKVLLLDEPFGALDARIRLELRRSLQEIQRELGLPTLFVTHDQEEAFELGDRIAVMALGRLIEVGPPRELYLRPQSEFVATFLGGANLLVGEATAGGVRIGPVDFPLATRTMDEPGLRRLQVLFRPEDVALAAESAEVEVPALGLGTVESCSFAGTAERLRLRLPAFVGVRSIAPPAPFGAGYFVVDASRSLHESRHLPLRPGDRVQVAVRRLHALPHPGLLFLLFADGTPKALAAASFAGELGRQTHARLTLVVRDSADPQSAMTAIRARLGGGLAQIATHARSGPLSSVAASEAAREPSDLALIGAEEGAGIEEAEALLAAGEHHVLLVRDAAPALPRRILTAVQVGEPGKVDIAFAGRLFRHLKARVTVLTVLPPGVPEAMRIQAQRFLESAVRTLERKGLAAEARLREGDAEHQILAELADGHDLLAVGSPLRPGASSIHLEGLVARLLARTGGTPVLLVRSDLPP